MNRFFQLAAQKLGFRQQSYQTVFEGSARQLVLVDLANYARAFDADPEGMSHDALMTMHGRRQMFFRIIKHLKLTPLELEHVYRPALMNAAARLQSPNKGDDE